MTAFAGLTKDYFRANYKALREELAQSWKLRGCTEES